MRVPRAGVQEPDGRRVFPRRHRRHGRTHLLKTLLAEYLSEKYGLNVPAEHGVLGRLEEPDEEELEDSFLRYAGDVKASRKEATAWHLSGTPEPDGYVNLVTMMLRVPEVKACAKEHGVTVTELLCAAMMQAIDHLQAEKVPVRSRRKPVKVTVPVNLRGLFPSHTLRNFASYVNTEIDPRLGSYTFDEICQLVHHTMGLGNDAKTMRAKIATNVASEKSPVLRVMPLFVKNIAMKAAFNAVGECKACLCLSNLGVVQVPEVMRPYIERFDFVIGPQANAPHNCGVATWGGYGICQLRTQHQRTGAGAAFLPCAPQPRPACDGREQRPVARRKQDRKETGLCIVSIAAWSLRTARRSARCAGRGCSTLIFQDRRRTRLIRLIIM